MSCSLFVSAQINDSLAWRKVDSVNKILKAATGKKLVDCYNLLAECYLFIWDDNDKHFDTACTYANKAIEEAKKINYAVSIGYAKVILAWRAIAKIDDNKNNNNTEPAYIETYKLMQEVLTLADQLKDDYLAGLVYSNLVWVEKWKGTHDKFKANIEKAIQHFEKLSGDEFKNSYYPLGLVNCAGCKGTEAALGHLYGDLAGIYMHENNPLAKNQLELAFRYYNTVGNKFALGYRYLELAQSYFLKYDYKTAEWAYTTSKNIFHEADNIEMELRALNELNKVYEVRGDFENGITTFKNSLKLIEDYFKNKPAGSAKQNSAGQAFFWMSRIYKIAGDYEAALAINRISHQYYPAGVDSVTKAPWLSEIGDTHRLLGNYDSAMYYLKGFQNSDNNGNNFGKISLGYLYLDMKEYSKARSLIFPFYQNLNRINYPIVKSLTILGNASLGEKKYEQALEYAREAQAYLNQMGVRVLMIDNYKLLFDIYDKMNKPDSALVYVKQYTSLKDSLINRQFYFRLNNLKNESEEQRKTSQINLLNKDNQLKEQKLKQQAFVKNGLIIGLILLLLLGVFIFSNF
jgi:tetratricopeptide (TPR) repeat protein